MTEPFSLEKDDQSRLILHRPNQDDVIDVRVRRAFPWSSPSHFISIRNKDGKEVLLVENLFDLPPDVAKIIDAEPTSTSFNPRITRVIHVDVRFGFQTWHLQTDRGPIEFRVQEREDIRFMPDGRFTVKDADGNLYEMPPLTNLDPQSRKAIESLV